jgi:hypothetical protein
MPVPERSCQPRGTSACDRVPQRFVLLSTQRSGTSWFMERMAAHPELGAYGEILLPDRSLRGDWSNWPPGADDRLFYTSYLKERGSRWLRLRWHVELFRYLDYIYEPRRELRSIGFKLMYDRLLRYPETLAYLRVRSVRVLHMIRANVLDLFLSREALPRRSVAHAWSPADLETIRVPVDTRRLVAELARLRRDQEIARRVLAALRLRVYEFSYEAALADDSVLSEALSFVGVQHLAGVDLTPTMLKLAPLSHRESISNFEQVEQTLARTRFAGLLRP